MQKFIEAMVIVIGIAASGVTGFVVGYSSNLPDPPEPLLIDRPGFYEVGYVNGKLTARTYSRAELEAGLLLPPMSDGMYYPDPE